MTIQDAIHRLEEENQEISEEIWKDYTVGIDYYLERVYPDLLDNYDFNQYLIDRLEELEGMRRGEMKVELLRNPYKLGVDNTPQDEVDE